MRKSELKDWTPRDFVEKFKQDILKCRNCKIDNKLFQRLSENPQFEVEAYTKNTRGKPIYLHTTSSGIRREGGSWHLTSWWPQASRYRGWQGYDIGELDGARHLYLLYLTTDDYIVPVNLENMKFHSNPVFMYKMRWAHHYRVYPKRSWMKWGGLGSRFINWNTNPLGEDSKE